MKGAYEVIVKNRRLQYKFTISRNITILRGDSATGKTTLIEMIHAYQVNGEQSGVTVLCKKNCVVLTEQNWQTVLSSISDSIVFIDEGNPFVNSKDFAKAAKNSTNYYVIAVRNNLYNLPYSITEIYGIKNVSGNKYQETKRLYSQLYKLYNKDTLKITKPELVVVEDSNAGFEFFSAVCKKFGITCISAMSKSKIYRTVLESSNNNILIIADGAAFGAEMENIMSLMHIKNIGIYLPESFEWILLKANILKDSNIDEILEHTYDFIESSDYFSWEQFFTALLTEKTKGTYLEYKKTKLNKAYIQEKQLSRIISVMPNIYK